MRKEGCWIFDVCLIVDANAHTFLSQPSAVSRWLLGAKGDPRLVADGLLKAELFKIESARRLLVQLDRAGRLRSHFEMLAAEVKYVKSKMGCQSNDTHVIALARVSGARTLVTFDGKLTGDFRDPKIINNPRGSVYRDDAKHKHLLRHTTQSCGIVTS